MLSTFLMRMLSFFSLLIDKAMAIEIAKGRPSGTATISKTIAVIPISAASLRESLPKPYEKKIILMIKKKT